MGRGGGAAPSLTPQLCLFLTLSHSCNGYLCSLLCVTTITINTWGETTPPFPKGALSTVLPKESLPPHWMKVIGIGGLARVSGYSTMAE